MNRTRTVAAWLCWLAVTASVARDGATDAMVDEAFRHALRGAVEHSGAVRFAEALDGYDRALALAQAAGREDWRAEVLLQRGVTFLHSGGYADARTDFESSAAIFEGLGEIGKASQARLRLVSMLGRRDPAAARREIARITQALEEAGEDEDALRFAELFGARLLVDAGDHEAALVELDGLKRYYTKEADRRRLADVTNLEAYCLQQLGRLEASRTAYREVLDAAFTAGNQKLLANAYCNLGDVERELGYPAIAETSLDRAIDMLDRIRARIPGGVEERMTYLDAQVSAYDGKIALRADDGDPVGALAVAERFHAKSLLEELRAPGTSLDRAELDDEGQRVLDELVALQRRSVESDLGDAERVRLGELERDWERVARDERRRDPGTLPEVRPTSIESVRRSLPAGTAMLAYWVHPERVFVWVIRAERIEMLQIPVTRTTLRDAVTEYLAPIRDRVRAEDLVLRGGTGEHQRLGARLYRWLVEPAAGLLGGVDHLIVIPDDQLWFLPFETLIREVGSAGAREDVWFADYASARYLLHDYTVIYAPSASIWAELAGRNPAGEGLVALAPSLDGSDVARERGWKLEPLPGALREASRVAALVEPGQALLGTEASEQGIKAIAGRYRFLHFATHGYLHDERPQLSGLFLWPSDTGATGRSLEDGLFQGFEVRELSLASELVSLAACNSGMGQLSRAEGILGMARAFLVAGSRNVLVSLWPVDDRSSGTLVEQFYTGLQQPQELAEALRNAKLALIGETVRGTAVGEAVAMSHAHPYFWGTYVLVGGDARNLPFETERPGR